MPYLPIFEMHLPLDLTIPPLGIYSIDVFMHNKCQIYNGINWSIYWKKKRKCLSIGHIFIIMVDPNGHLYVTGRKSFPKYILK